MTSKASINVKANQATVKAHLNDTFSNKTTQWFKAIYLEPEVKANEKSLHKALQLALHSAYTKEQLFLLQSCFRSAQYSPHSFKQWTGRGGNTSRLLRKFIFRKQTQTSHRDSEVLLYTTTVD